MMETFGRKEKLFELQKAWAVALSGRPRAVLIEGADGVGKTHLVRSFLETIRHQKTTEKRARVGAGACFEVAGSSETLRPAWEGLAGLLDDHETDAEALAYSTLAALSQLSAVVPDALLADIGVPLARVLIDGNDSLRIPREQYLRSPEILIRDSLLTLSARFPVALFIDDLQLADAATLTLLANLLDALWEQDEPCSFMLVLAFEPELARSRGVLPRLEEHLQRHDRPNNRIITRIELRGLGRSATTSMIEYAAGGVPVGDESLARWLADYTDGNPRATRDLTRGMLRAGLVEPQGERLRPVEPIDKHDDTWRLPPQLEHWLGELGERPAEQAAAALAASLDPDAVEILGVASLQGRRFSPAAVASACGLDELEVVRRLNRLSHMGVVSQTRGPAALDFFGHGVFAFQSARYADAFRATMSREERRLLHGRIANYLLLQRSKLRDGRARLERGTEVEGRGELTEKFRADARKLDQALRTLDRIVARHLVGAARFIEATSYLSGEVAALEAALEQNEFALTEQARDLAWLTRLAERTLLALTSVQPASEPADTTRAAFEVALIAASCRNRMGCYQNALALLDHALDGAAWLGDPELQLRATALELEVLYRSGRHRLARQLVGEILEQFERQCAPRHLIEALETFQKWEHPDVSIRRLQNLADHFLQIDRRELAAATHQLILGAHADVLFERYDTGELGHRDLAEVAAAATKQGFTKQWLDILLRKFDARVHEERVLHGWYYLRSREPLGQMNAAIELLERSQRMGEIFELTIESAQGAGDARGEARARIGFAEVFGRWRNRGQAIVEAWERSDPETGVGDQQTMKRLRQALLTGRISQQSHLTALRRAIEAADRQRLRREAVALRARLVGEPALDQDAKRKRLDQIERLVAHADHESLSLYVTAARVRMAEAAGDSEQVAELGAAAEAAAAKFYARAAESDRVWLAETAAQIAQIDGRELDRDAWYKHQIKTLGRSKLDERPRALPPIDLAEAASEVRGERPELPSLRQLLTRARRQRSDGELDEALESLRLARRRADQRAECLPGAREVEEELSLAHEACDSASDAIEPLQRSVDYSRRLGQLDVALETLGRAVHLARAGCAPIFWDLHAELLDTAKSLGSVDQLDRAFDISYDLLQRARRSPVFEETEPMRLEDSIEQFVRDVTSQLRQIGAGNLLAKWDAMLARVVEKTEQIR